MSDIDLKGLGEQVAPAIKTLVYVLFTFITVVTLITFLVVNGLLKNKFKKLNPLLRIAMSLFIGILFSLIIWRFLP